MEQKQFKKSGVKYFHRYVSLLGCIESGLDYLQLNISPQMIYGASGFAFAINILEQVCPSSPTAFNYQAFLYNLLQNIGVIVERVVAQRQDLNFTEKQTEALQFIKENIAKQNTHCFAWELDIPEYYNLIDVDEKNGYYYLDLQDQQIKGPKNYSDLGNTQIAILEVGCLKYNQELKKDFKKMFKESLNFAIDFSQDQDSYKVNCIPGNIGLKAYDTWISCLQQEKVNSFGLSYNSQVWLECRQFAVQYLQDAYQELNNLFPFEPWQPQKMQDNAQNQQYRTMAIQYLQQAQLHEKLGIDQLRNIIKEIN